MKPIQRKLNACAKCGVLIIAWAVFTIAVWFLISSNVFNRADMQYYVIYWLSGDIYFFVILAVVTITLKTSVTNYAHKFTREDKT